MGRAQLWSYTKVYDKNGIKISLYGILLSSKEPAKVWKKETVPAFLVTINKNNSWNSKIGKKWSAMYSYFGYH